MCVCVFVVMSPPVTGLKPQQSGCRARTQPLNKQRVAAASRPLSTRKRVVQVVAKAQQSEGNIRKTVNKLASAGLAALVASAPISSAAIASEFDVLEAPVPETSYYVDDGGILSKSGKKSIAGKLRELESQTGYHLNIVTMRKLQFTPDPFEFSDKVLENWYPTVEQGDKKGVLLLVSSTREAAISGGPSFLKAVGNDVLDSIISETVPILGKEEKFNEATLTSIKRISAAIKGEADPGAPKQVKVSNDRTYKTKKETDSRRGNYGIIVGALLVIAFVVPMVQYFAITKE